MNRTVLYMHNFSILLNFKEPTRLFHNVKLKIYIASLTYIY